MPKISSLEFDVFRKYIFEISGITLGDGKEYLVETRLNPILRKLQCVSYSELYYKAKRDKQLEEEVVDAISTNETSFFRDILPFELLQYKIIPDLIDKRTASTRMMKKIPIRIWSAGCSTGQEIYSIAFTLEAIGLDSRKYDIQLYGTDVSNAAVAKASYGLYSNFELSRGLSRQQVEQFFDRADDHNWKVKEKYRWLASFETNNIFDVSFGHNSFDIVFCRNVGIYFAPDDRKRMYQKLCDVLTRDGYLIIGSTESLTYDTRLFIPQKYLRTVFYQPNPDAMAG
ncbi:MAG: protein-glutamate O-methyltransferase CheR [Thermodesulfobacteriota bacterium]|nr:protein-glutamate O-methyltransferase CheR [Thermodesulfobacteriota bacterium]